MPRQSEGKLPPSSSMNAALGRRLRSLREGAGMSLRQFASSVGVCVNTVRRHEAGNMMLRADDLISAADALRVRPAALLTVEDLGNE